MVAHYCSPLEAMECLVVVIHHGVQSERNIVAHYFNESSKILQL